MQIMTQEPHILRQIEGGLYKTMALMLSLINLLIKKHTIYTYWLVK